MDKKGANTYTLNDFTFEELEAIASAVQRKREYTESKLRLMQSVFENHSGDWAEHKVEKELKDIDQQHREYARWESLYRKIALQMLTINGKL